MWVAAFSLLLPPSRISFFHTTKFTRHTKIFLAYFWLLRQLKTKRREIYNRINTSHSHILISNVTQMWHAYLRTRVLLYLFYRATFNSTEISCNDKLISVNKMLESKLKGETRSIWYDSFFLVDSTDRRPSQISASRLSRGKRGSHSRRYH